MEHLKRISAAATPSASKTLLWTGMIALALAAWDASKPAAAADWSSTNVQLLHGNDYAVTDRKATIFTFEHANGWKYGDNFFWVDITNPESGNTSLYGEFSPRLSIGKMVGKDLSMGIVKDVMLSGTWEMGEEVHAYLLGVGLPLKLPGFAFADFNLYWRQSYVDTLPDIDSGAQITIDWLVPFQLGGVKLAFEGFADYAWGEDPKEDNLITAPRLLVDVGDFFGAPDKLQAGIEYQIWRNKFGINGADEDVAQIMVKWTM